MLTAEGIRVRYGGAEVLHGVDLTVDAGEFVGILGRNGAGKTTLLNALAGIRPMIEGEILLGDRSLTRLPAHRRARAGVALVQENKRIFRSQSVLDNLHLGAYSSSARRGQIQEDLDRVFELFPILATRRLLSAGLLSGGQQQMLAIGQALMARPRLLLLDEPSAGLAPVIVEELFATLSSMDRRDLAILLVEQLVHQTLAVCSRVYVLDTGSIVLSGSSEELRSDDRIQRIYMADSLE